MSLAGPDAPRPSFTSRARRNLRAGLVAVVAGLLVAPLMPAAPAAAVTERVDGRFFGVHDSSLSSIANGTAGSLRLWDAGVTWRDIETAPGVFDFSRLDAIVRAVSKYHVLISRFKQAIVIIVLGGS